MLHTYIYNGACLFRPQQEDQGREKEKLNFESALSWDSD